MKDLRKYRNYIFLYTVTTTQIHNAKILLQNKVCSSQLTTDREGPLILLADNNFRL